MMYVKQLITPDINNKTFSNSNYTSIIKELILLVGVWYYIGNPMSGYVELQFT